MPHILSFVSVAAGTVSLTLAAVHFVVWLQRPASRAHLWFSLAATGAAGCAAAELALHSATSVDAYVFALKAQHPPLSLLFISLAWFMRARFGTGRRWMALTVSAAWLLFIPLNLAMPFTLIFKDAPILHQAVLPWGETFTLASGVQRSWKLVMDAVTVLFLAYVADASWLAWRQGKHGALVVGGSILAALSLAGLLTPLVDAGVLRLPYLISVAFVAIVAAMGIELAHEVVRASRLGEDVLARERRWRAFLQGIPLLVVELDRAGRVVLVNPHFSQATGIPPDALVGRPLAEVIPSGDRDSFAAVVQNAFAPGTALTGEGPITGSQGVMTVSWSTIQVRNAAGEVTGLLCVGADVTELRRTEQKRDESLANTQAALAEVQSLRAQLEQDVIYLKDEITRTSRFSEIAGSSDALAYVLHRVEQVAPLATTVLIEGETGVGKELIAQAIHNRSPRASRPLVRVNCAVLPPTLVEAELFGHERGAFTGADRLRRGRFDLADRGTILLDEISELPLELQAKLLRVLQEGEFERVGGDRTLKVDVRVIASTNRSLQDEVRAGRFREDLYYRLAVFQLTVPPLRKRVEDIPALVEAFVHRFAGEQGKIIECIPPAVLDELRAYAWPGNVRELQNIVERAVIGSNDGTLRLAERLEPTQAAATSGVRGYRGTLDDITREYVQEVLELSGWRIEGKDGAAERLGLHPNTLRFRMRKLGIGRRLGA